MRPGCKSGWNAGRDAYRALAARMAKLAEPRIIVLQPADLYRSEVVAVQNDRPVTRLVRDRRRRGTTLEYA